MVIAVASWALRVSDQKSGILVTTYVVYFDRLLGAARTQKLVETFFSAVFQPFLFILKLYQWFHSWNQQKTSENEQKLYTDLRIQFNAKHSSTPKFSLICYINGGHLFCSIYTIYTEKALKWKKKVEKQPKKNWPAFGYAQHPKAGRNTQQTYLIL